VVCIPHADGEPWAFRSLAEELAPELACLPMCVLRSTGLGARAPQAVSVPEMVEQMAQALGPYQDRRSSTAHLLDADEQAQVDWLTQVVSGTPEELPRDREMRELDVARQIREAIAVQPLPLPHSADGVSS
jgi:surfactin synthase thioesterase subunit